jgi:hypothetical protein
VTPEPGKASRSMSAKPCSGTLHPVPGRGFRLPRVCRAVADPCYRVNVPFTSWPKFFHPPGSWAASFQANWRVEPSV